MAHIVSFAPEAEAQLIALVRYISSKASPEIADRYAGAIIDQCEKLENFPFRGSARDEVRPGLRTISFRRRVTIAYSVIDEHVTILGVYSGGQDFATLLAGDHFSK